jgi:hemolysin D
MLWPPPPARLKQDKILVGDKWVPLAPGMATQVEIKTGERRLIEFFLSPFLRYRDEALRER